MENSDGHINPVAAPFVTPKSKSFLGKLKWPVINLLALVFWIYIPLKLFVFDFDSFILENYFPEYSWILSYKFFFLIGLVAIVLLWMKKKSFLLICLYILFSPLIWALIIVPFQIVTKGKWFLGFILLGLLISFTRTLKFNFVTLSFLSIATLIITLSNNTLLLSISALYVVLFLVLLFARNIYSSFNYSEIFLLYSKVIKKIWSSSNKIFKLDQELKSKSLTVMSEKEVSAWANTLQYTVFFNKLCFFLAKRLKEYHTGRISLFYFTAKLLVLTFLTVHSFALLYFYSYKIDPQSFHSSVELNLLSFLYFSTNTMFGNGITDFYTVSWFSRLISTVQVISSFLLLTIIANLVLGIFLKRNDKEVEETIELINQHGTEAEEFIKSEYNLTPDQAYQELTKLQTSLIKLINYFSSNLSGRKT